MTRGARAKRLTSLPPVEPASASLLILGSMPGAASLAAQQYYAHPQNRFWRYMQAVFGVPRDAPYDVRLDALRARGIALWDVLRHCERPGSLDADIVRASEVPNDFAAFLGRHPGLRVIALNGGTAYAAFRRHAPPQLGARLASIEPLALPSTSPANASLREEQKLAAWKQLAERLAGPGPAATPRA